MRPDFKKFTIFLFMIFILTGMGATPLSAQDTGDVNSDGLEMDVILSFGTHMRYGCYFPVRVNLSNSGTEDREGRIRIVSGDPEYRLTANFMAECDLPRNASKSYYLYPYIMTTDPSPSIIVQYVEDEPILSQTFALETLGEREQLWIEIADEGTDFNSLNNQFVPIETTFAEIATYASEEYIIRGSPGYVTSRNQELEESYLDYDPGQVIFTGIRSENLPNRMEGYSAVQGAIINTNRFPELSYEKKQAVMEWVLSGGALIVWLGDEPDSFERTFLTNRMDGDDWTGPRVFTSEPVQVMLNGLRTIPHFLDEIDVTAGFHCTYATQQSATILLSESGYPALQHVPFGQGDVLLSGIDLHSLKVIQPSGLGRYLRFMMGYLTSRDEGLQPVIRINYLSLPNRYSATSSGYNPSFVNRSTYNTKALIDNALQSENLTALPSLKLITMFLAFYILLVGPVNYFALLKMRRRELLWITIPVLVTVFVIISYSWAANAKGRRLVLTRVNIVDAWTEHGVALENSWFSLFSPSSTRYEIELEENDLLRGLELPPDELALPSLIDVQDQPESVDIVQFGEGNRAWIENALIRLWSEKHFESVGVIEFSWYAYAEDVTFDSSMATSGPSLSGRIVLEPGMELELPVVIYPHKDSFYSDVIEIDSDETGNPGSFEFNIYLDGYQGLSNRYRESIASGLSDKEGELRNVALVPLLSGQVGKMPADELLVAGYISDWPGRRISEPRILTSIEESLVIMHIPFEIEEGSQQIENYNTRIFSLDGIDSEISQPGELFLEQGYMLAGFNLPPSSDQPGIPENLYLTMSTTKHRAYVSVEGFNHIRGEWEPLQLLDTSDIDATFGISNASRYVATGGHTLLVRIRVDENMPEALLAVSGLILYEN